MHARVAQVAMLKRLVARERLDECYEGTVGGTAVGRQTGSSLIRACVLGVWKRVRGWENDIQSVYIHLACKKG